MISILRLIRAGNLVIIALNLYAFRYLVIQPYYGMSGTEFQMGSLSFGLMVGITMLIAATGYLINDYFDREIDRVNHPDDQWISGKLTEKTLWTTALLLSVLAITGMIALSRMTTSLLPFLVLLTALLTVWWYAGILKRSFILGNLAVSLMASLTLGMAWFFEWLILNRMGIRLYETHIISCIAIGICFFAFMLSLIREIVKDMEDIRGDALFGCRSVPIVKGVPFTKKLILAFSLILFTGLIYSQYWLLKQNYFLVIIWLILAVEIPYLLFLIRLRTTDTSADYHKLSRLLKWIMIGGISSMLVIWLNFRI